MKHKIILDPNSNGSQWLYREYTIVKQDHPKLQPYAVFYKDEVLIGTCIYKSRCIKLIDAHIRSNELKLINWHNDGYPPIDLNANHQHVRAVILQVLELRKTIEDFKKHFEC